MNKKIIFLSILSLYIFLCFSCKADVELYVIEDVTISYKSEYGDSFKKDKTIPLGYKVQELDLPALVADGFEFKGWYIGDEKIYVGHSINKDSVFTAKWKKVIDKKAPDDIQNLKVISGNAKAELVWENPDNSDFGGVLISITPKTDKFAEPVKLKKNVKNFIFDELQNNQEYKFLIQTYDSSLNYSDGITCSVTPEEIILGTVEDIMFDPPYGYVDFGEVVTLSCETPNCNIYYTTDGVSIPDENSKLYTPSTIIRVDGDDYFMIKAIAMKENYNSSSFIKTYNIKKYDITFDNGGYGIAPDAIKGQKRGNKLDTEKLNMATAKIKETSAGCGFEFEKWTDMSGQEIIAGQEIIDHMVLTANWKDVPIKYTGNVKVTDIGISKVTLSWKNPNDADFDGIIILGDNDFQGIEISDKSIIATKDKEITQELTGLKDNTTYNFVVKFIDKGNNISIVDDSTDKDTNTPLYNDTVIVKTRPATEPFKTTDTPIKLKEPLKIEEQEYEVVEFGDWPQTRLTREELIKNQSPTIQYNGWNCYTDVYGAYYVKLKAQPYEEGLTFDDGTTIRSGQEYYFRLEPIRWLILRNKPEEINKDKSTPKDNTDNTTLLLSEKCLDKCPYFSYTSSGERTTTNSEKIKNNNYQYSEIRAMLNGIEFINSDNSTNKSYVNKGFLQKAFCEEAKRNIENKSNGNDIEKIFLLSEDEVSNKYSFGKFSENDVQRIRKTTDYSRAIGVYVKRIENSGWWWLKTPTLGNNNCVNVIDWDGYGSEYLGNIKNLRGSIVPALKLNIPL